MGRRSRVSFKGEWKVLMLMSRTIKYGVLAPQTSGLQDHNERFEQRE